MLGIEVAKPSSRRGAGAFRRYYSEMLGGRWSFLEEALSAVKRFETLGPPLLSPYHLDFASVVAARALGTRPADRVLDMCAAPGGKTLVIALALGDSGTLVSNERSSSRRARLIRVLDEHLPPEIRPRVTVSSHDARTWGLHEKNAYDRVLLDAPCSSEAHLVRSPSYLEDWSPNRTRSLSLQAHAMIAAAIDALRPGGTVLYSTCAISDLENDGVVGWALERRSGLVEVDRSRIETSDGVSVCESTRHGCQIWPDRNPGVGPIYIARLRKLQPT